MAWFHKTLTDMLKAIEEEKWDKVEKILEEHTKDADEADHRIHNDLSKIAINLSKYGDCLGNISRMLKNIQRGGKGTVKTLIRVKTEEAIGHSLAFEATIKHLIKQGKFLE